MDVYSLPRIELFDCFIVHSGFHHWISKLKEESTPLTAFTVGLLGFHEHDWIPFGFMNAPATFQRLMENCLGDLHPNWCIIYFNDIVIFPELLRNIYRD